MQAAEACNPDDRVVRMLDRIADEVEDYESTADAEPPVSEDERATVLDRHRGPT